MYLFKFGFEAINKFTVHPLDILRYIFGAFAVIINARLEFVHWSLSSSYKCLYDISNKVTYMILTKFLLGINVCACIKDSQAKDWNTTRFFLRRVA